MLYLPGQSYKKGKMATQTYYELLEIMQAEAGPRPRHECPICRLALNGVNRYLQQLSLEQVNEVEMRLRLRLAGGFCNNHAYAWLGLHDALGTAIIYEDILREVGRRLAHGDFLTPSRNRTLGLFGRKPGDGGENVFAPCPLCRHESQLEERIVSDFAEGFGEQAEFRAAYAATQTAGVCLPHFRAILPLVSDAQSGHFSLRQAEKLAATQARLHQIIEKLDASLNPNPAEREIGPEREALSRAIWQIVGLEE